MENYSLLMGDSSVDGDGGGVDGEAFRGHFPIPAACRNRDCPQILASRWRRLWKVFSGFVELWHGAERRTIGYSKPYPNEYELIPLPPKYRLPDFSKFNGSDGSSSIEHVSRYLAQLGTISASDELRVRFFAQSLTGSAFGWYTSLPPNSVQTWKQLEEQFHM
ncbi:hypothetical protein QYE76_054263 [Lolium multiflorum]|uniref:Retrotransposon gag domain-containing protein n=1 Tax=Lolium multiflorum TaxID=4521 RepID=A0AAD8SYH6_LOLMU|nr:hypothetical protein QYE76_054263 [Lolium multiflorum]